MIEIKRHFGNSEDSREILEDIENRIAEMFSERIQTGRKEVINREDVDQVIAQMGRVSDFDAELGDEPKVESKVETDPKAAFADTAEQVNSDEPEFKENPEQGSDYGFTEYLTSKKLMRDMDDKVLSGVCSGLAHYFNIEAKWVRIIFVLFFLFGGSGVLLYFVLWAVMPKATTRADKLAMRGEQANLHNFKKSFDEEMKGVRENFSGAGEHISRGARSVGDSLGSFFSVIGKILAVLVLIWAGLSIIGIFVFFVFNVLNIMGYQNPMFFPPLEVLDPASAFFAILAGTVAIIIPLLAIFFIMLRVIFKLSQ
jgi:phage shock protein PspC (stress-responsive transcriptional regulator)